MNPLDDFDFPISQDFADYIRYRNDMPVAQRYPSKEYHGENRTSRPLRDSQPKLPPRNNKREDYY